MVKKEFLSKAKNWCKTKLSKAMTKVGIAGTAVSAMAVTASAETGTGGSATSGVSDAVSVFSQVWTMISGNPVLTLFIGVAVLGAGIGLFSRLFSTVRH